MKKTVRYIFYLVEISSKYTIPLNPNTFTLVKIQIICISIKLNQINTWNREEQKLAACRRATRRATIFLLKSELFHRRNLRNLSKFFIGRNNPYKHDHMQIKSSNLIIAL